MRCVWTNLERCDQWHTQVLSEEVFYNLIQAVPALKEVTELEEKGGGGGGGDSNTFPDTSKGILVLTSWTSKQERKNTQS